MSPPDGNVVSATERTQVDPTARRLAIAARIRELAERAQSLRRGSFHEHDTVPQKRLHLCALGLERNDLLVANDLDWLTLLRRQREPLIDEYPLSAPYYRAVVAILDEALGLLRGLR